MFSKDKYKPNLFNQDSDSDSDGAAPATFGTNKEFAKNFNKLRSKELLKKHKNESDSSGSSDDSDDSSDQDTINPKFDEAFYKALASIKKKDPTIYTDKVKFFDEFDAADKSTGADGAAGGSGSRKALTVVDYERKILLEKGGRYEDSDDEPEAEDAAGNGTNGRPQSPSYNQEQQNLRNEFKRVIEADEDDEDESEWGGIFKRRDKSKAEEAAEEEQYTKWLAGEEAANIGANAEALKPLKEYWTDPRLAKEEVFLRDYILNNGYTKKSSGQVPSYDEIVGNNTEANDAGEDAGEALSDDEAELEKQAEFEHKYNFRFEEPDAEFIKRYPRTIENSVRRTDDRRKEKRQEVKERKERDKTQKLRELEMLSQMKKREIEDKIAKLRMVTGAEELPFDDADLDGDFDPDEYDRKMQAVFNSEYYQVEEEGDEKPEFPADLEDLQVEDWDNYDPTKEEEGHCEDEDFNMDCDYEEGSAEAAENAAGHKRAAFQSELIDATRAGGGKRKRKRKSKFLEVLQQKRPVFDPNDKTFGEYLDEYYQLDYEDVIGDTPCRFKYTETVPNDFGLTVEEILLAKNKELNQWASLKKATQIRPEHVERSEVGLFQQKGRNEALKRKILQSLFEVPSDEEDEAEEKPATTKPAKKSAPVSVKTANNFRVDDIDDAEALVKIKEIAKPKAKQATPSKKSATTADKSKSKPNAEKPTAAKTELISAPKAAQKRSKPDDDAKGSAPAQKKPKLAAPAVKKSTLKNAEPAKAKANKKQFKPQAKGGPVVAAKKSSSSTISDERLRAFGINPKKFHNKQKYGGGAAAASTAKTETKSPAANKKQPATTTGSRKQQKQQQHDRRENRVAVAVAERQRPIVPNWSK